MTASGTYLCDTAPVAKVFVSFLSCTFQQILIYLQNPPTTAVQIHIKDYQGYCSPPQPHKYILTYLLTYSMEQSPSWEANWFCS